MVIFNERLGEFAQKYLHKGRKVYVEGQLQTRKWTGQDGQERYSTEVVLQQRFRGELTMLDSRSEGGGGGSGYESSGGGIQGGGSSSGGGDLDDEIPF